MLLGNTFSFDFEFTNFYENTIVFILHIFPYGKT